MSERPFNVTPDPHFMFLTNSHREALAALVYGIRERRGFLVLTGEVGTGKTMVLNCALDKLGPECKVAYLFNTTGSFEEILTMALFEWGICSKRETLTKSEGISLLNDFAIEQLGAGNNVVLIIDEAQNLSREALESLRLLSNLETRKFKLIQLVLLGQPEFDGLLRQHNLRQLVQRINIKRTLAPLTWGEIQNYLNHRLDSVGYHGPKLFTFGAMLMIWNYSNGIPRKINSLCDNALLIGYGLKKRRLDRTVVREAVADLQTKAGVVDNGLRTNNQKIFWRFSLAGLVLVIIVGLFSYPDGLTNTSRQQVTQSAENTPVSKQVSSLKRVEEKVVLKLAQLGKALPQPLAILNPEAIGEALEPLPAPKVEYTTVLVQEGQTLSDIVYEIYGKGQFPSFPMDLFLKENPEVSDPNQLYPGQKLRFPLKLSQMTKVVAGVTLQ